MYYLKAEFTSPNKWFKPFAWAVQLFERTPYSHVRLLWNLPDGQEIVFEASGSHVKVIGEEARHNFPVKVHKAYTIALSAEEYDRLQGMLKYSSLSYGTKQILGIALARIFRLKKNPFADGRRSQVCSELVALVFEEVLDVDVPEELDLVGPKGIADLLEKLGYE